MNTKEIKDMAMRADLMPSEIVITLIDKIESLRSKLTIAEEALEWILNNKSLIIFADDEHHVEHFTSKAREALAKIGGEG